MKELLSSKRGRSEDWINQRGQRLLVAAKQNPFQQTMYASHLINLKVLITLILQYQEHLTGLEQNIERCFSLRLFNYCSISALLVIRRFLA